MKILNELLKRLCNFKWIKIYPLNIFDQGHLSGMGDAAAFYVDRNLFEAGQFAGLKSSFAGYKFETSNRQRAYKWGVDDSDCQNRICQFLQLIRIKNFP